MYVFVVILLLFFESFAQTGPSHESGFRIGARSYSSLEGSVHVPETSFHTPPTILKEFSAGGFAGKPFTWDYSSYFPNATSATCNDSRITWRGLTARMVYPTPGDYYVTFVFKTPTVNKTGIGKIHIVLEKVWTKSSHRATWADDYPEKPDGTIDYSTMNVAAARMNLNTIAYVPTIYGHMGIEFYHFLQNTSLYVWPILSNPKYATKQTPYYADYEKWAEAFANLSLIYPNLDAFIMDDLRPMVDNPGFTPAYLKRITQAKDRINPNLRMLPVLYFDYEELDLFEPNNPYRAVLSDGAEMWYWQSYENNINWVTFDKYISSANAYMPPAPRIIGVYPIAFYWDTPVYHPKSTIERLINGANTNSEGVIIYNVPWKADTSQNKVIQDAVIEALKGI